VYVKEKDDIALAKDMVTGVPMAGKTMTGVDS
jgi:hypothetical protein